MGCGSSTGTAQAQPVARTSTKSDDKILEKSRTDKKYQRINERYQCQDNDKMQENVTLIESETLSFMD